MTLNTPKKNCLFQYAHTKEGILGYYAYDIEIVEDTDLISLEKAKKLWSKYLPDFIKHLQAGGNPEMVIWIDCEDNTSYRKTLAHVDKSTETDGTRLFETKKEYIKL